jgi:hypothetical protein
LLAPWEGRAWAPDIEWRGFRVPWVYTLSDDIFVLPPSPPSPDTLSWRPDEQPERLDLNDAAAVEAPKLLNDEVWSELGRAHRSPLFETPIAHFLVRAFLADGVDEFLAHITTIEAALGLQSDYDDPKTRRKIAKGLTVTQCMAARVSALLGAKTDGEDYCRLFNLRSLYLHGRRMSAAGMWLELKMA